jgi:hypothetical protein
MKSSPISIPWVFANCSSTSAAEPFSRPSRASVPSWSHSKDQTKRRWSGSTPLTMSTTASEGSPLTWIWSTNCGVTARMPGTSASASPASLGSGSMLSLVTTRSLFMRRSKELFTVVFMPAANTATKTTRPRPTMSADDVVAVRPGLRMAFSRASRPGVWKARSSGQPASAATGRTMWRAVSAIPTKSRTAPPAIDPIRAVAGPPPKRPVSSKPRPSRPTRPAIQGAHRRARREGGAVPASACTGVTRVARSAGASAASTVTPMPTVRETTIVRGASSMPASGMPKPAASNIAPSSLAKPRPPARPRREATTPRTSASPTTAATI